MNTLKKNELYESFRKCLSKVVEFPFIRIPCKHLESNNVSMENWAKVTPVFIIGPPRSGTTLLYQMLSSKYYFSYVNRLMNLFYFSPLLMAKISYLTRSLYKSTMKNKWEYGTISGIFSPDQGEKIWDRIIYKKNVTHFIPSGFCSKEQIYVIRKLILGIQNISNYPFLGKEPKLSLATAAISEAFPKALYIVIFREPVYNAQSIYIARRERKRQLDNNGWWDCKPKEYRQICFLDSIEQSVKQDYYILKQIDDDRKLLDDNMVWIRYEDLCENTERVLEIIKNFLIKHGLNLPERDDFVLPTIFSKNERKIEPHLFNRIKREVDSTFNGWKPEIGNGLEAKSATQ